MVIFKSKQKKFEADLKIKFCGKRLYPTECFKYLGVKIDTSLTWQHHVNHLSIKLNRANTLLFKMRKYVNLKVCVRYIFASLLIGLNKSTCQIKKLFHFKTSFHS